MNYNKIPNTAIVQTRSPTLKMGINPRQKFNNNEIIRNKKSAL